jgi:uncharacterized protein (DUF1800 family)
VARIASVLERKDGDLTAVYRALIAEDAAWAQPLAKVKTPEEFLVSILRGLNLRELEQYKLVEALSVLGERPFFANSPQGWPDDAGSWAGPDAIKTRLEYASQVANRAGAYVDARQLAPEMLGDIVSQRTKDAVARAASPEQGLTLLLMSPEFQRR